MTTSALLITTFPESGLATYIDDLRRYGIAVARVEKPNFRGPLDGYGAIVLIDAGVTEAERTALRKEKKAAGVTMITLPPKRAQWPALLAGMGLKPSSAAPRPAPAAEPTPPALPSAPPPAEPATIPFGAWLKSKRGNDSSPAAAAVLGVSDSLLYGWERGTMRISPEHLDKIRSLYGDPPPNVEPPLMTLRPQRKPAPPAPLPVPAPVVLPVPTNGHRVAPMPLAALRGAARALRIEGPVTIAIGDAETVVSVGAERFSHSDPDEAVAMARAHLAARLDDLLRMAREAAAALGGVV